MNEALFIIIRRSGIASPKALGKFYKDSKKSKKSKINKQ